VGAIDVVLLLLPWLEYIPGLVRSWTGVLPGLNVVLVDLLCSSCIGDEGAESALATAYCGIGADVGSNSRSRYIRGRVSVDSAPGKRRRCGEPTEEEVGVS
jgi:hypothetical protein